MMKISEVVTNAERLKEVDSFRNIKPIEKTSVAEADSFWDGEFSKPRIEIDPETRDFLIAESFNRSEEDVSVEFEIGDKLSTMLDRFQPETWSELSYEERLLLIRDFASELGEQLGLKSIPQILVSPRGENNYGGYDWSTNTIIINSRYLEDPKEVVNTLAHEMRHAFQQYRAEQMETLVDALYKTNLDNYIPVVPLPYGGNLFYTDYYNQYIEVEARVFANIFSEGRRV